MLLLLTLSPLSTPSAKDEQDGTGLIVGPTGIVVCTLRDDQDVSRLLLRFCNAPSLIPMSEGLVACSRVCTYDDSSIRSCVQCITILDEDGDDVLALYWGWRMDPHIILAPAVAPSLGGGRTKMLIFGDVIQDP